MKAITLLGMLSDLNRRIIKFDVVKLVDNIQRGKIDKDRIKKLIDDVYNLEEDLIVINCEKSKQCDSLQI